MRWFQPWMVLPLMPALHFGLRMLEKSNTTIGRRLRDSTHDAWQMAMDRKQHELDELRKAEPRW